KHANGNSLFHNQGGGHFDDASGRAGVQMARWSWSSDAWDFDHDGYPDLYIANGMISGPDRRDLSSFFWRQVVAATPLEPVSSPAHHGSVLRSGRVRGPGAGDHSLAERPVATFRRIAARASHLD